MGQKVSPHRLTVGINRTWDSRWFARKEYPELLRQDAAIRTFLEKRLDQAGVSRIVIERPSRAGADNNSHGTAWDCHRQEGGRYRRVAQKVAQSHQR